MKRWSGYIIAIGALFTTAFTENAMAAESTSPGDCRVYIGTYVTDGGESIFIYRLNGQTGELTKIGAASGVKRPSFLALAPNGRFLYSVSEIADMNGKPTGGVCAFAIQSDGTLELLNKQASQGAGPCHVSVDPSGSCVAVANYGGGSVALLPITESGSLVEATSAHQHEGSSVNPRRQQGPHAHSINFDAKGQFAIAADLGLDKLLIYKLSEDKTKLEPNAAQPFAKVPPGAGPRHFAFHPNGKFAYVINELDSTICALSYDAQAGKLNVEQTLSTLPDDCKGDDNTTAEVQVHPSGKFVYGSNRGHDSIAIFAVDPSTGHLTPKGHQSTKGNVPRNFGIDPSGNFLLAANQNSDNVVVFRIDTSTGSLTPTGHEIQVPKPVCVKFLPVQ